MATSQTQRTGSKERASSAGENGIPQGWSVVPLSQVTSPSKSKIEPGDAGNQPYVGLEHIEAHTTRLLGHGHARDVRSTKAVFRKGDVLYGKLRPYLGKVCLAPFDGLASTDILVFSQAPLVDPRYLMRFLSQQQVAEFANRQSSGTQLPRVSFSALGEMPFPLPPILEQKRIVDHLEQLLIKLDSCRDRLERLPTILARLRQAVLVAACSGQLTAAWRNSYTVTETAVALLQRLESEREAQWRQRNPNRHYRPAEAVADEELPPIPATWKWTNFDHCAWEITVGHVGPMKHRYVTQGTPFLRSQNVRPLRFDPRGLAFIESDFHAVLRKSALRGGEILVTRTGANTGDCCVYPHDHGEANCADLVVTRPLSGLIPAYGAFYVSSPEGQTRIGLRETGMAQPHFNIGAMRVKPFPLPPVDEQREIVRRVEALFAVVDEIEAHLRATTARAERLPQSILTRAFRGQLVPTEAELAAQEERPYESAEELLTRISRDCRQAVTNVPAASRTGARSNRRSKKKTHDHR